MFQVSFGLVMIYVIFSLNRSFADSLYFSAPVYSDDLLARLKLFSQSDDYQQQTEQTEQWEVWASSHQQLFICGRSVAKSGAVALFSTEGITTYQMTEDKAVFNFHGVDDRCASKAAFEQQPVSSTGSFLLRRNRHKKQAENIWVGATDRKKEASSNWIGGDGPNLNDFFPPPKPFFFPMLVSEAMVADIVMPFLKTLTLFQQDTSPDDYNYVNLVVRLPGVMPVSLRLSQQQFLSFLENYGRSGDWRDLFDWIKVHLSSRSSLVYQLVDNLDLFSRADELWLANPEVFQAMVAQLQGILETSEHDFSLELELSWLNHWQGKIEIPGSGGGGNQDQQSGQVKTSDGQQDKTESAAQTSHAVCSVGVGWDAGTSSGGDGSPPPVPKTHSYNCHPCPACRASSCQLRQPAEKQPQAAQTLEEQIFNNWLRLINIYTSQGIIIRMTDNVERSLICVLENRPASGTYLFPGSSIRAFSREAPGIILFPDVKVIARFKENAGTNRVLSFVPGASTTSLSVMGATAFTSPFGIPTSISLLGLGFSVPSLATFLPPGPSNPVASNTFSFSSPSIVDADDYDTLTKVSRRLFTPGGNVFEHKYHKNHLNQFSFALKMLEQNVRLRMAQTPGSGTTGSSGHIEADGSISAGRDKYMAGTGTLVNNEVIITWDNWQDALLGFVLSISSHYALPQLHSLICGLLDIDKRGQLKNRLASLPVVFYYPERAMLVFTGTVEQVLSNQFSATWTIGTPSCGLRLFREQILLSLLKPEAFTINIEYVSGVLNARCEHSGNRFLLQVLRVACNRQLLEAAGFSFSEEEALLLSYMATLPEHAVITQPEVDQLIQLFESNGGTRSIAQDIAIAMAKLGGLDVSEALKSVDLSGRESRSEVYYYLLKTRLSNFIPLSDVKLENAAFDKALLGAFQKQFMAAIDNTIFVAIGQNIGHAWPLLLSELRLAIPAAAVKQLRLKGHNVQRWPYAEIMASIPGELNLLDQVEALILDTSSPLVNWLYHHALQNGLPVYPGTLRSGGYVTTNTRERLQQELKKRPAADQVNAVQRRYQAVRSQSWENAEFPVWRYDPLAGMDNAQDYQASMIGQSGATYFDPNQAPLSQTGLQEVRLAGERPADDWKCSICFENHVQEPVLELACKHQLHQPCLERLLSSDVIKRCPECKQTIIPSYGNQPAGTMEWEVIDAFCPGESVFETIRIQYEIPQGRMTVSGQQINYDSDFRDAYLPNHKKGRKALFMLKTAFERGLVLTVGYSLSRGISNVVTWNNIPHKTSLRGRAEDHAYPDAGYVDRLIQVLKELDVPEPDN